MNYESFALPLLIILIFSYRIYKSASMKKNLPGLLAAGAEVIDVRSPAEFAANHNPLSKNMPLDQIDSMSNGLDKEKTYILCCASGARSAAAMGVLKRKGFKKVLNAGSWKSTLTPTLQNK